MDTINTHRFFIEAGELRAFFGRLSSALARSLLLDEGSKTKVDQANAVTANGLRALVDAVQRRQTEVASQAVERDPQLASTMRLLTSKLRDSYRTLIAAELGLNKIQLLISLLSHPVPDILDVLGKSGEENFHSDIIRWLLDPRSARTIAPAALQALVSRFRQHSNEWQGRIGSAIQSHALSVRREHAFCLEDSSEEDQGRLDLLISGPGFRLIIENKVGSEEHDNQTDLYWQWLKIQPGNLKAGIILSPAGLIAQNQNFESLSYIDLLNCLLEGPSWGPIGPTEETILASYVKTLAAGILRQEFAIIGTPREG